jgi:hypothetical protein
VDQAGGLERDDPVGRGELVVRLDRQLGDRPRPLMLA